MEYIGDSHFPGFHVFKCEHNDILRIMKKIYDNKLDKKYVEFPIMVDNKVYLHVYDIINNSKHGESYYFILSRSIRELKKTHLENRQPNVC